VIRTAFVLAAGLGTRLRPLTENTPKPLLPIGGLPMICHLFNHLIDAGVNRIIVNTFHCADAFSVAFPTSQWRGIPITFSRETTRLETGGGLKNIEPLLTPDDGSIFVCNGDIFAAPDFARLASAHLATDAEATLLLRSTGEPLNVRLNSTGTITDMRHRLGATDGTLHLFTGIYCARRTFFAAQNPNHPESVIEPFLRRIAQNTNRIQGITDNTDEWHDLGTIAEYEAVAKQHPAPH
jgi:NDP-sugar pyrophosphorylase family protein